MRQQPLRGDGDLPDITLNDNIPTLEVDGVHRSKRRKLDGTAYDHGLVAFKYGKYGQVLSGRLKMEIVSCDGGNFPDNGGGTTALYGACETNFSLEKLVIKAPERGFTAPVQEGMIFVSMTANDLLSRTTRYKIEYRDDNWPQSPESPPTAAADERLTFLESLHDPGIRALAEMRRIPHSTEELSDHDVYLAAHTQMLSELQADEERLTSLFAGLPPAFPTHPDAGNPANPNENASHPSQPAPAFTITTTSDDESSAAEDEISALRMADRMRRERRWALESQDEELHDLDPRHDWTGFRPQTAGLRAPRRSIPSAIEPAELSSAAGTGMQASDQAILAPQARFFIRKSRSKVVVKFDPPTSGKYILLKLWSPQPEGNIDVQSIIAYGFAGPRYFPCVEPR
ncbi:hypothetical protein B0A49_04370 [Cryomyces minteri]|uniref:Uncharacterized protein n=1 Tax=Cryomyces minteri TaxID=331657 RepID=A0A4U0X629_9PEZI|nr:hypothetical protein B0A49_04370 [Cryomyces minteri]